MADVLPQGYVAQYFDIQTTLRSSNLSTVECLVWCTLDVEEDASIYGTLIRPLDIMMDKWKSFSDNRGQSGRGFIDRDVPMEDEEGATVDSRDRSGLGHRGRNREWGE